MENYEQLHQLSDHISKSMQVAHKAAAINRDDIATAVEMVKKEHVFKAMDTAEVGGGFELVPTSFSPDVINQVRLDLKVTSIFPHIYMPAPTYKLPVEVNPPLAYIIPENTGDTGQTSIPASNVGTGQVTFNAVSIGTMVRVSKELDQDSIAPIVPLIQRNLLRSLAVGFENAALNGDISGTHQDSDVAASNAQEKAFPGLRRMALINGWKIDNGGGAISLSKLRAVRAMLGIYSVNPDDLVLIVGPKTYVQMLNIPEAVTMDKYGPQATVMTGELMKLDGMPVIVSPFMRETLNASGVFDNTTVNRGTAVIAHKGGFLIGDRQMIELDQDNTPKELRQIKLLADMRVDFKPAFNVVTQPTVGILYNIGL